MLFFLCFSSPARVAFCWIWKKKKHRQTRIVDSATGAHPLACSLADSRLSGGCNFFTIIARKREKNVLLLRSLMEEDDRINVSHHSLFKKHDAFHSCTSVKKLSWATPSCNDQAAVFCQRVWSRRTKSYCAHASCWNRRTWTILRVMRSCLTKPGCVFDWESKKR